MWVDWSNTSSILCRKLSVFHWYRSSVMVEETGVPGEDYWPSASKLKNRSYNVLGSARIGFEPRRWERLWSVSVCLDPMHSLGHRGTVKHIGLTPLVLSHTGELRLQISQTYDLLIPLDSGKLCLVKSVQCSLSKF